MYVINPLESIKNWYLSAIEINRYPGCTTRTSVPSQPTWYLIKNVSKVLYKKKQYKINKKTYLIQPAPYKKPTTPKLEKKTKKKKKKKKKNKKKQKKK